jgi:hypothetical protein
VRAKDDLDGRNEAIPPAGHRFDKHRGFRRIAQRPPNLPDDGIDACLHVNEHVLAPQLLDDVVSADELTSMLDQQDEQIHRPPLESDRAALAA